MYCILLAIWLPFVNKLELSWLSCRMSATLDTTQGSVLVIRRWLQWIQDSDVMSGLLHHHVEVCGHWFQFR